MKVEKTITYSGYLVESVVEIWQSKKEIQKTGEGW
jgi:hypothetical protein